MVMMAQRLHRVSIFSGVHSFLSRSVSENSKVASSESRSQNWPLPRPPNNWSVHWDWVKRKGLLLARSPPLPAVIDPVCDVPAATLAAAAAAAAAATAAASGT
ncbi:hypothetical protein KM472_gp085 [Cynomolgus macaque cytomegalovirus strain Ottawa]|uniref:Uncharacterized protein n=1 Tax=macacine betaherpesvirus 8 TaxID=2560567 RepID=G8H188_9BETA|nr:hypothetical protein KM472_gp085 [Cynomolgus macaque cytomegalovirus strain Ottawa]AEQ32162.1 hypothetical protein cy82 [Cynomolgus macaque cytomegalovirus strain Ottawa]